MFANYSINADIKITATKNPAQAGCMTCFCANLRQWLQQTEPLAALWQSGKQAGTTSLPSIIGRRFWRTD